MLVADVSRVCADLGAGHSPASAGEPPHCSVCGLFNGRLPGQRGIRLTPSSVIVAHYIDALALSAVG